MHYDPRRLSLPCEHRRLCLNHVELLCCSSTNQKKAPPATSPLRDSQEFGPSEQTPSWNVQNWFRVWSDALTPPQPLQSWIRGRSKCVEGQGKGMRSKGGGRTERPSQHMPPRSGRAAHTGCRRPTRRRRAGNVNRSSACSPRNKNRP